jgi:hypothetical protein
MPGLYARRRAGVLQRKWRVHSADKTYQHRPMTDGMQYAQCAEGMGACRQAGVNGATCCQPGMQWFNRVLDD